MRILALEGLLLNLTASDNQERHKTSPEGAEQHWEMEMFVPRFLGFLSMEPGSLSHSPPSSVGRAASLPPDLGQIGSA